MVSLQPYLKVCPWSYPQQSRTCKVEDVLFPPSLLGPHLSGAADPQMQLHTCVCASVCIRVCTHTFMYHEPRRSRRTAVCHTQCHSLLLHAHLRTYRLPHISAGDFLEVSLQEPCFSCPLPAKMVKVVQHGRPRVSCECVSV